MDCRGQGGRSEDPGGVRGTTLNGHIIRGLEDHEDRLYYRGVFLDTAQLARVVMGMSGGRSLAGRGDGGKPGRGADARLRGVGASGEADRAVASLSLRLSAGLGAGLGHSGLRRASAVLPAARSASRAARSSSSTRLGYVDVQHLAPRIRAETLLTTGLMDTVTPPSTVFAAYNKIAAPKRMLVYPDFGHEGLPGMNDANYGFLCGL